MLPLFFQVVLLDSATKAGARLAIPSLATPIGGILAGVIMSRYGKLIPLIRLGALFMTFGNGLVTSLSFHDRTWKYMAFIFPANLGQGIIYPAILFTTLASFEHSGTYFSSVTGETNANSCRPCGICLYRVLDSLFRQRLGCCNHGDDRSEYLELEASPCVRRNSEQRTSIRLSTLFFKRLLTVSR